MTVAIPVDPIDLKHLLTFGATKINEPPLHRTQDSSRCHQGHLQSILLLWHIQPPKA